jgi:hypothetical protein
MTAHTVERDERTVAAENASYRWAYLVLSFGLLASTLYRSFVLHQSAWDLLALVVIGGAVTALYQGRERVLTRRWTLLSTGAVALALAIAAAVVIARR